MTAVTASPTLTQPPVKSQPSAPAQLGPAGAAAPAKPAVSPGISAAPSNWDDDIDRAAQEAGSTNEARFKAMQASGATWHDGHPDPAAAAAGERKIAENEKAQRKLLSAIAASHLGADEIRRHFANSDRAAQMSVDAILLETTVADLKELRSRTSPTESDPGQWEALDRAVDKVLSTYEASNTAMHAAASTWHDGHFEPKAKATWKQKVAESKQAKKELVSAILASPFSDIRGHFAKDLRKVHAVEDALQGRAFERR